MVVNENGVPWCQLEQACQCTSVSVSVHPADLLPGRRSTLLLPVASPPASLFLQGLPATNAARKDDTALFNGSARFYFYAVAESNSNFRIRRGHLFLFGFFVFFRFSYFKALRLACQQCGMWTTSSIRYGMRKNGVRRATGEKKRARGSYYFVPRSHTYKHATPTTTKS